VGGSCDEDERLKGAEESTEIFLEWRRTVGRPRGRWLDVVDRETNQILKCRYWR
jgi:hypothetical protein